MAGRDIKVGETFEPDIFYAMRPQKYADGLPSERYEDVIGKRAARALKRYDPISEDAVQE